MMLAIAWPVVQPYEVWDPLLSLKSSLVGPIVPCVTPRPRSHDCQLWWLGGWFQLRFVRAAEGNPPPPLLSLCGWARAPSHC